MAGQCRLRQSALPASLAAWLLACTPGHAHGLAGGSPLDELAAGFGAPLDVAAALLLIAAAGICAALWDSNRFTRLGWGLLAGTAAGPLMAWLLARSGIAIPHWPALALGIALALMTALARRWSAALMRSLLAAAGCLAVIATLLDHAVGDLTFFTGAGLVLGVVFFTAASAAAFSLPQMLLPPGIARLGLRIVASWTGAIAILLLAFTLRGAVG
ncbi:hypothetical protein [Hoeflea marina]|nr:hypothetical protein [Hoeflea marina]